MVEHRKALLLGAPTQDAAGVDGSLHDQDAAGGQWLAGVVVLQQHGVFHRVGNLRHPAEHVNHGLISTPGRLCRLAVLLGHPRRVPLILLGESGVKVGRALCS